MEELILLTERALDPFTRIINNVGALISAIFRLTDTGFGRMLIDTIVNNSYLLISVSLVIIGFVIGILRRFIDL